MFSPTDTIVSIVTPPGRGGVGVVRISGPAAQAVAEALIDRRRPLRPRYATLIRVKGPLGQHIDEALATFFPAPRSYTAEDTVEISAHGSPALLAEILRAAVAAGARLAEPGEFTLRAFLNGRIDLVQAEAVGDLIAAVTPLQARVAFDQLEGTLTREIAAIDRDLFDLAARLEASLDFPDEGYHFIEPSTVRSAVAAVQARISRLLERSSTGRMIREGGQVVLLGRPNVGKSSLFNHLVGADRAIVSQRAGTTRDLVSEAVDTGGVRVVFVDTAGVRESTDEVEQEGVARSRGAAGVAEATIVVCDASRPCGLEDRSAWALGFPGRRLLVLNKIDCGVHDHWARPFEALGADETAEADPVRTSLVTGEGLPAVRASLLRMLGAGDAWTAARDHVLVTNVRHERRLVEARDALGRAVTAVDVRGASGSSEELVLADLAVARRALESIVGRRTSDDLLRHIFEQFCVGK